MNEGKCPISDGGSFKSTLADLRTGPSLVQHVLCVGLLEKAAWEGPNSLVYFIHEGAISLLQRVRVQSP
jgi:hypothetical protein